LRWSRRRKIIAILILITAILIGGIIVIIKILNSPAVGTITPTVTQSSGAATVSTKPSNFSDKYISFTYPGNLEVLPIKKGVGYLDVVNLYSNDTDHSSEHVAISIMSETLANDSGVNYRRTHTELYKEQPSTANMVTFTSTANGYEKTAYIIHGDQLTSVSVTAPGNKDLSSDFVMIINSLKWK
jgi:hypothetical protein